MAGHHATDPIRETVGHTSAQTLIDDEGKIKHVEMTRLILGGNLIGGVAHARDLVYVSPLIRHYFTDEKILETWRIAEAGGIDTMAAWPSPRMLGLWETWRGQRGGKIQWLGHTGCDTGQPAFELCND